MIYIYGLADPRNGVIRYVGKTNNLQRRMWKHLSPSGKSKCRHCAAWLNTLKVDGIAPKVTTLEVLPDEADWSATEKKWIKHFRDAGHDLTNITDGGEGAATYGRLGKKNSPEHIRKCVEARTGVPVNHTKEGDRNRAKAQRRYRDNTKKKVFRYSLDGQYVDSWDSAVDYAKESGGYHSNITRACKANGGISYGYLWSYHRADSIPAYIKPLAFNHKSVSKEQVEALIALGHKKGEIAKYFGISYRTLWGKVKSWK